MRIAIDFDGTIVFDEYPKIGPLKPNAKEMINKLVKEGHMIIINTCRAGEHQQGAEDFLDAQGIQFHFINENDPKLCAQYPVESRKMSADLYIDDKQLGGIPDDWEDIYMMVQLHIAEMEGVIPRKAWNRRRVLAEMIGDIHGHLGLFHRTGVSGPINLIGAPKMVEPFEALRQVMAHTEVFAPKLDEPFLAEIKLYRDEPMQSDLSPGQAKKEHVGKPHEKKLKPTTAMKQHGPDVYMGPRDKSPRKKKKKGGKR